MKKVMIGLFILLGGLAGCDRESNLNEEQNHSNVGEEVNQSVEEEKVVLMPQLDHATDEFLANFSTYEEVTLQDQGARIVFWTENTITNFKFLNLSYDIENSKVIQEGVAFSAAELTPEKPLVFHTWISELSPSEGISFTDELGNERFFYISWSGRDGSLSLVEF